MLVSPFLEKSKTVAEDPKALFPWFKMRELLWLLVNPVCGSVLLELMVRQQMLK